MDNVRRQLFALDKFKCLGGECSRTCCSQWYIELDDETYAKWRGVSKKDRLWLMEGIDIGKQIKGERTVKFGNSNNCSFLTEDKLCKIHSILGHDLLPGVCGSFPRRQLATKYRDYFTASLSCPEIARLLINNHDSKKVFRTEKLPQTTLKNATENDYVLAKLDEHIESVLNFEACNLGGKLFYISDIFSKIIAANGEVSISKEIADEIVNEASTSLSDIDEAIKKKYLTPNPVTAGSIWSVIYDLCISRSIDSAFLESSDGELTKTINESTGSNQDFEKIYAVVCQYKQACQASFDAELLGIIQAYIRVTFSYEGFPLAPSSGSQLTTLIQSMIGLCMLQLLMWMKINKDAKIPKQYLQDLIVDVQRQFIVSDTISRRLEEDQTMTHIEKYNACFLDLF